MNLNVNDWKEFYLNKIYNIQMGNKLDKNKMTLENPKYNFVTRIESNNGVDEKVDEVEGVTPFDAGDITVALGGSIGSTFVQEEPFYTAQNVAVLKAKFESSDLKLVNLFISRLIKKESEVKYYAFGRELNKHINKDFTIYLPICRDENNNPKIDESQKYHNDGFIPDFQFMEYYIKSLHHKPLTTKKISPLSLTDTTEWRWFQLNKLFHLKGGYYNKKPEHAIKGEIPFLGSTDSNNCVTEYYSKEDIYNWNKTGEPDYNLDNKIYEGNCIVVTVNGSVGNAYYQPIDFTCSHDVTSLYIKDKNIEMNKYVALFICSIILKDKYKWSYGRKPHSLNKYGKSEIMLPIQKDKDGNIIIDKNNKYHNDGFIPDWDYMENYIKSLPYGDRI